MGKHGMKMSNTADGIARRAAGNRSRYDALAPQFHADYERLQSLKAVARHHRTSPCVVRAVLLRNGYSLRVFKSVPRQANGVPVPHAPKTAAEITALIAQMTYLRIPPPLRIEWRRWPLVQRAAFIARVRARHPALSTRPTTPFSANVEPFDYGSPHAHALMQAANRGRNSRTKAVQLRVGSQGVIYRDRLYFWAPEGGVSGAYYIGPWRRGTGRPALHHIIWAEAHGQPVPAACCVRFVDGNRNNFAPANLVLTTKNEVCRENQAAALFRKSRATTALLLRRAQHPKPHDDTLTQLRAR